MSRSMWSGVISFGMVTIPVKLHTATESHNIAFHQLHNECDTRIKEQRWCPHCERVVEWKEIVKGYEYSKNEYIELTDDDFEKLPLPSKHTIDLSAFVDAAEISPLYFDKVYYVEIDEKGGLKPYKLLLQVMESKNVVGIAKIAFRNRERLCALRPVDGTLCLQTLLYDDEIRPSESSKPSSVTVTAQEKKMAETLVGALKSKFAPEKFKDNYQSALKKLIQAKLKGKDVKVTQPQPATGVMDLMEALQASLNKAKGSGETSRKKIAASTSKPTAAGKKTKSTRRTKGAA